MNSVIRWLPDYDKGDVMSLRMAATFALLCVGGLGIATTITHLQIVEAVNAKLPSEQQFGLLGWYATKSQNLHNEYRRLYPEGKLLWRQGVLAVIMLFCGVLAAEFIGFNFLMVAWLGGGGALLLWLTYFRRR